MEINLEDSGLWIQKVSTQSRSSPHVGALTGASREINWEQLE